MRVWRLLEAACLLTVSLSLSMACSESHSPFGPDDGAAVRSGAASQVRIDELIASGPDDISIGVGDAHALKLRPVRDNQSLEDTSHLELSATSFSPQRCVVDEIMPDGDRLYVLVRGLQPGTCELEVSYPHGRDGVGVATRLAVEIE